MVKSYINKWAW